MVSNEKWTKLFEQVAGRKPSPQEYMQGKESNFDLKAIRRIAGLEVSETPQVNDELTEVNEIPAEPVAPSVETAEESQEVVVAEENASESSEEAVSATEPVVSENVAPAPQSGKPGLNQFLTTVKPFVLKYKIAVAAVVAALVVALIGWNIYQAQPKSIVSEAKVTFSGYDGYGTLDYNSDDLSQAIAKISYQKAGFSGSQAEALAQGDSVVYAEVTTNPSLNSKYQKAQAMISTVSYQFDKTSDLSNGDTVVLSIKTTSTQSPIKSETKKFKVEGLDKVETISTKDLLEEYPVEFVGMNGYGRIELPEDDNGYYVLRTDDNAVNLSNGDKVEVSVSDSFLDTLKSEGKKVEKTTFEVVVSGLEDLDKISNLSEALAKNDTYAKSNYENSSFATYKLEKQKDYLSYENYGYDNGKVYLVTVYKVTTTRSDNTEVEYVYYGYNYVMKSDGSLDLESASKTSGWETKDLENLEADLKTDGYKEYTSSDQ